MKACNVVSLIVVVGGVTLTSNIYAHASQQRHADGVESGCKFR
jgi:hypothetical protein